MTREEVEIEGHEAEPLPQFRFDPSLMATWQCDVDAACAAGDRLVAKADPDAVPLPIVRLPVSVDADQRQ
jgi:hypothetical protein